MKCGAYVIALSKTAANLDTLKAEVGEWSSGHSTHPQQNGHHFGDDIRKCIFFKCVVFCFG